MAKSKAPTGLSAYIAESKFVFTWKCGDSNYSDGQNFQYRIGNEAWISSPCSGSTRQKTITINYNNYYPYTDKKVSEVSFRVQGNRKKYKKRKKSINPSMSAWATYTYKLYPPAKPEIEDSWGEEDHSKSCRFSWSSEREEDSNKIFLRYEWQSVLIKDCEWKDGKNVPDTSWEGPTYSVGTSDTEDVQIFDEVFEEIPGYSFTRWFRIRSQGCAGSSDWEYSSHVYSKPLMASDVRASIQRRANSNGYTVTSSWITKSSHARPIDSVNVEYAIVTPTVSNVHNEEITKAQVSCPSDAQWISIRTLADTSGLESAVFNITDDLNADEMIFLRVNTVHDDETVTGTSLLIDDSTISFLSKPTIVSIVTDSSTHRAQLTLQNDSVNNSILGIYYRTNDSENEIKLIGIFSSQYGVTTIQVPDWGDSEPCFGVRAYICDYSPVTLLEDGVIEYAIENIKSQSKGIIWAEGVVPLQPSVTVTQIDNSSVKVSWDWPWMEANETEISWADREDAWESTSQPTTYIVEALHQGSWIVTGLTVGTWYFRVRLIKSNSENAIYGFYSDTQTVKLSSAPITPSLTLSEGIITEDGSTTCYWSYVSTDGTPQMKAEITEAFIDDNGNISYSENNLLVEETAQHATLYPKNFGWLAGEKHYLCGRVVSSSGEASNTWSAPVALTIAEKPIIQINSSSLELFEEVLSDLNPPESRTILTLTEMPFDVSISGAGADGLITLSIERASNHHIVRPDENDIDGFEGETVILKSRNGAGSISITQDDIDLVGCFDDGAVYRMVATVKDQLGQKSSQSIEFHIRWKHQAYLPEAVVATDDTKQVIFITPIAGDDYVEGDTCDIYRLSVDKPELIVKGAEFGTCYVDPYPTLGEFGGHRLVTRTLNGDYITPDGTLAWLDLTADDNDIIDIFSVIIDFEHDSIFLPYDISLSNDWRKDIQITHYLGGSIRADWNPYIERSATVSTTSIIEDDPQVIEQMRRLAVFPGICHVRTPDGSSYAANVEVSESREEKWVNKKSVFQLNITKVDAEGLDGMTLAEWTKQQISNSED